MQVKRKDDSNGELGIDDFNQYANGYSSTNSDTELVPPSLPRERILYIHSIIPNDGERILLFSSVYRMNLFDEKLF